MFLSLDQLKVSSSLSEREIKKRHIVTSIVRKCSHERERTRDDKKKGKTKQKELDDAITFCEWNFKSERSQEIKPCNVSYVFEGSVRNRKSEEELIEWMDEKERKTKMEY